jgi:hypothetical protein
MDAADELIGTAPTTIAGMHAAIAHLVQYDEGCEPLACGRFLATLFEVAGLWRRKGDVR